MNIVVGITGASGVIYGIKLIEELKKKDVIVHLIMSKFAMTNIEIETNYLIEDVTKLADYIYDNWDLAANVSSGSYLVDGVVILPCSMKTLSSVANGYSENLIARVCDVALKERRKLIMCPRETPLNAIHLENMLKLARLGVDIIPPVPAFYNNPESLDDIILSHTMKIMDHLNISFNKGKRWNKINA